MFAARTNWKLEPNRLARVLEAYRVSGKPIFDLTASNPTTCGFAYPEAEILSALSDTRALFYSPESKGMRSAREAAANYYKEARGFRGARGEIDPERIILTSGTSEAYSYILRLLCEPGDEILVPAPSYPLFEYLADLNDVCLGHYPLLYDHGWQIDLESLRVALTPRTQAILVVHPNNPTGSFVKPQEAEAISAIAAERDLAIVSDEVFLDFANAEVRAPSFAFEEGALAFTLSGLSKISALPQMKLAWTVVSGPAALANAAIGRLEIIADTYLSPGTPVQLALPKLLAIRGEMQRQLKERVESNLNYLDAAISKNSHITRLEREGGWYAILRVPSMQSDEELVISLLEKTGVLVHPGRFFDSPRDGFLVVSLIAPETEFAGGVRRVLEYFAA
ncbi:MAG TPA: pyridoxal phosphate-dependent aminotransferase [Candidatus Acidoferrales bacterium]|nr:pyridoxal phosphate-dependent aminotransferase [Candidatus Acidoferrales bacterium]